MGWICPHCGSENAFGGRECLACMKRVHFPYLLRERIRTSYARWRVTAFLGEELPLPAMHRAVDKNMRRTVKAITVYTVLACVCLLVLTGLHIHNEGQIPGRWGGLRPRMGTGTLQTNLTWSWRKVSTRFASVGPFEWPSRSLSLPAARRGTTTTRPFAWPSAVALAQRRESNLLHNTSDPPLRSLDHDVAIWSTQTMVARRLGMADSVGHRRMTALPDLLERAGARGRWLSRELVARLSSLLSR